MVELRLQCNIHACLAADRNNDNKQINDAPPTALAIQGQCDFFQYKPQAAISDDKISCVLSGENFAENFLTYFCVSLVGPSTSRPKRTYADKYYT